MINRIIKNDYALSVFTKLFTLFTGLAASSFLTRYLGLTYKGEYSFINQVVSVTGLILNLGIYQSYTYYYRKEGDSVFPKYVSLSSVQFFIYLFMGGIVTIIAQNITITLICVMIPFQVLRMQLDNIMLVQSIRFRMCMSMLSSFVLMIGYLYLFLFLESGVEPIVISIVIMDITVIICYLCKERKRIKRKALDRGFTKEVIRFGILPMLSALLVTLNYSVDIFFLKRIGTPLDLSLYSVAAGIMNYVWLVPDAFKDILYSRVARNNQKSSVAFSTKFSLLFLLITTVGFVVLGKLFIRIMYGNDFVDSYSVTLVLFLGVFSMVFFKIFGIVLLAEGKRVPFFVMLLVSVLLNVFLNYLFIPLYGMYGAAFASVGSYNLCGIMFLIYFSKMNGISIKKLLVIDKDDIDNIKKIIKHNK